MERTELNGSERRALSKLVGKLFDGAVIALPREADEEKFVCFRMKGEEIPVVPLGEPGKASDTGLFMSGESYIGGRVSTRLWLYVGALDEVLRVLEHFGDVRQLLARFQFESSARKALGTKEDKIYDLTRAPSTLPVLPRDRCDALADVEFASYDFGDDCAVVGSDGWERVEHGDVVEFAKNVYVTFEDGPKDADSTKVSFNVKLKGGEVDEVYALEHLHGSEIGQRGRPEGERQRG